MNLRFLIKMQSHFIGVNEILAVRPDVVCLKFLLSRCCAVPDGM